MHNYSYIKRIGIVDEEVNIDEFTFIDLPNLEMISFPYAKKINVGTNIINKFHILKRCNSSLTGDIYKHSIRNVDEELIETKIFVTDEEFLNIFDFYYLTNDTWKSLNKRLLLDPTKAYKLPETKRYQKSIKIDYNFSNQFTGLLNHIRTKNPNSIFNEIKITSSSLYKNDEEYSPQNVIQYENSNVEFCTSSQKNSWLCFDFIDHQIEPNYYLIRACDYKKNSDHPKSWVIEGSNDDINWDLLDTQNNNSNLNGANFVASFSIKNPDSKKYRFLRMRQLESWCSNNDFFNINNIEFFGTLF